VCVYVCVYIYYVYIHIYCIEKFLCVCKWLAVRRCQSLKVDCVSSDFSIAFIFFFFFMAASHIVVVAVVAVVSQMGC